MTHEINDFDRKFEMAELFMGGASMRQIGFKFKTSRQRVHQILKKCGIDTGLVLGIRNAERLEWERREKEEAKRESDSKRPSVGERFMSKVTKEENGCWKWHKPDPNGYGRFSWFREGKTQGGYAHRFSYEFFTGHPIPKDMEIDHVCRVRSCVNPEHLQVVTHQENVLRGKVPHVTGARRRGIRLSTCIRGGHPMVEGNIYLDREGKRRCAECIRLRHRKHYLRKLEDIENRIKSQGEIPL